MRDIAPGRQGPGGVSDGGRPPIGHEVRDRKLEIMEGEAQTVRHIFERHAELGSVLELGEEPAADGLTAKRHVPASSPTPRPSTSLWARDEAEQRRELGFR